MAQPAVKYYTEKDYLAFERNALDKHEYYKGEVFAISGASFKHNLIESNLRGALHNFSRGKECKEFGSNLRIHIPLNTLYTYPGIIVICDDPEFTDEEFDTITNPAIIIEILSPSTANYDRGAKFDLYREISTLKECVLVDSTTFHVVVYTRNADGTWTLSETKNPGDSINLHSINFNMLVADIYDGFDKINR
jgi:Uma2 family endonuclease